MAGAGAVTFVNQKIAQRKVLLFSKSHAPACKTICTILDSYKLTPDNYEIVNIEARQDCTQIENYFQTICLTDARAVPQLFVEGKYLGGEFEITRTHESGALKEKLIKAEVIKA